MVPIEKLKWAVAVMLVGIGVAQLRRHYHRPAGMRIGTRDLTIWSFLVATAHGAGLMALTFVMRPVGAAGVGRGHAHAEHGGMLSAGVAHDQVVALLATSVHTLGYVAVTAGVALVIYEKVGLRLLRRTWININLLWALALIGEAYMTALATVARPSVFIDPPNPSLDQILGYETNELVGQEVTVLMPDRLRGRHTG